MRTNMGVPVALFFHRWPGKSSHCHTQIAGCKQSQNLNGFSVRGSMPRPARCEQGLTIGASSDGVPNHSSCRQRAHPRMSPLMHTLPSAVDGLKTPSTPVRVQHPRMSPLMLHPSSRCCLQTCCLQLPTRRARRLKHMILYKENKVLSVLSTGRRMCSTMLGRP